MDFEYSTKQEADTVALSLQHLIGTTVKHKNLQTDCIVKDIFSFPKMVRNDGADNIQGYDVKVTFDNQPFSTWSKALETAFVF